MTKLIAILTMAAALVAATALGTPPASPPQQTVTISAKGLDVRSVLHDVFTQANRNYVLEPNVRFVLYLSVKDIDFDEALQIICKLASLDCQVQNGIYYVGPKHTAEPTPALAKEQHPAAATPTPTQPTGVLSRGVLMRRVTTRLSKAEFTKVVAELTRQTGIPIELEPSIAKWKLDAFFSGSSLRYVLDRICAAGKLTFRLTDHLSVEIIKRERERKPEENRVTVFKD